MIPVSTFTLTHTHPPHPPAVRERTPGRVVRGRERGQVAGNAIIELANNPATPPAPRNAARRSTPATDVGTSGRSARKRAADGEAWAIHLAAEGEGPPLAVRIRRFLKRALRSYGLRCTAISGSGDNLTDKPIGDNGISHCNIKTCENFKRDMHSLGGEK